MRRVSQLEIHEYDHERPGKTPKIPDGIWEEYRGRVRLWHGEGLTKQEIIDQLASQGLYVTISQLIRRMKKWNLLDSNRFEIITEAGSTRQNEPPSITLLSSNTTPSNPSGYQNMEMHQPLSDEPQVEHLSHEDGALQPGFQGIQSDSPSMDLAMLDADHRSDFSATESAIHDTTHQMEHLVVSGPETDIGTPIAPQEAEIRSLLFRRDSQSSITSLDSSQVPTKGLSLNGDVDFTEATGMPSQGPLSESSFRTSITEAAKETLTSDDHRFYPRVPGNKFFTIGRVFAISRPSSKRGIDCVWSFDSVTSSAGVVGSRYLHCKLVVVHGGPSDCLCIPVTTYGAQGLSKKLFPPSEIDAHAIVYLDTSGAHPQRLPGEGKLSKCPIAVKAATEDVHLHPASRLNFAKVHLIPYAASVMDIGQVKSECVPYLALYFRRHINKDSRKEGR